ncbi:MAG: hypothetical protein PUP93_09410 [Rhizonema sp. NSF051]|nr:hypothetical protein [Rhizonema sp. NSF051]
MTLISVNRPNFQTLPQLPAGTAPEGSHPKGDAKGNGLSRIASNFLIYLGFLLRAA